MKLIGTKIDRLKFFYKNDDLVVGKRIALQKYEIFESFLIQNLSAEKGVAIDVGANIGYYTLLLAKKFKKVYSFEPEKDNLSVLKKNINVNKLSNVKIFGYAASDRKESLKLGLSSENYGDHQILTNDSIRKVQVIKSISLDESIKVKVALIKVDTQGWEPKVILGTIRIITKDKPTIFMEFWPEGYRRAGLNFKEMLDFLVKVYGGVYMINDELNLLYKVRTEDLEKLSRNKKGYMDLVFKQDMTIKDKWLCVKKFNWKNYIKSKIKNERL